MVESNNSKIVAITPPAAIIDNASATTASIDTKGFDWCDIYVHFGAMDIAAVAFKLQESDTDGSYADITGATFDGGTSVHGTTLALPSATADNGFWRMRVNLKARKRFLDLVLTLGDGSSGTYVCAWAVLSRAGQSPNTLTESGLAADLMV